MNESKLHKMDRPLTKVQLELVVHLANGMRHEEIAVLTNRSESSVRKILTKARKAAGARTMPHLVSLVIASGVLEYEPEGGTRTLNGNH